MKMKRVIFFFYTGELNSSSSAHAWYFNARKFVFVNRILLCFQATNSYQSIYPVLKRYLANDIFLQGISNTVRDRSRYQTGWIFRKIPNVLWTILIIGKLSTKLCLACWTPCTEKGENLFPDILLPGEIDYKMQCKLTKDWLESE